MNDQQMHKIMRLANADEADAGDLQKALCEVLAENTRLRTVLRRVQRDGCAWDTASVMKTLRDGVEHLLEGHTVYDREVLQIAQRVADEWLLVNRDGHLPGCAVVRKHMFSDPKSTDCDCTFAPSSELATQERASFRETFGVTNEQALDHVESLAAENSRLRAERDGLNELCAVRRAEVDRLEEMLRTAQVHVERLRGARDEWMRGMDTVIGQRQRILSENAALKVEVERLQGALEERQHAAAMACENPDPKCDCPGCSIAREEASEARTQMDGLIATVRSVALCDACIARGWAHLKSEACPKIAPPSALAKGGE